MSKSGLVFLSALLSLLPLAPASGQGIVSTTVEGNTVRAAISLPGDVTADLTLTFEQAVGLSAANLGLSAELVSPTSLSLLSRLPSGGLVSIPAAFPVLVSIEPPSSGGLSFSGVATVEIYTHNLQLTTNCPLRLFVAAAGGPFVDTTTYMGTGSYRAGGARPGFSEFLIVADLRSAAAVAAAKFTALRNLLEHREPLIDAEVYAELDERLTAAEEADAAGSTRQAIEHLDGFVDAVKQYSGCGIPNVWRAPRDIANVAGELRAAAGTLRFSLNLRG